MQRNEICNIHYSFHQIHVGNVEKKTKPQNLPGLDGGTFASQHEFVCLIDGLFVWGSGTACLFCIDNYYVC